MFPASLGHSSTSHGKVPLNVVFIIDTHLPPNVDEVQTKRAVLYLKRSLVRILLYFQCHMDPKFQWTYQFFNTRMPQDICQISNRMLQNLSMNTVNSCVQEYQKIIEAESTSSQSLEKEASASAAMARTGGLGNVSPCFNLRRQLVHSMADFGLGIASYQSPMKPAASFVRSHSLQKHFPPVTTRNYMYVLSPLPRTWSETTFFLDGKRQAQNRAAMLGPRRNDILEVLKGVKDAFFDQGLWDRFLDQRMSLNWIDTGIKDNSKETSKTRISAMILIRSTLEQIMKAFGGHIIPQRILCQTFASKDIYSFATIFRTYRSLQINPGLGVKMSKDSWQALPSAPVGLDTEDVHSTDVIWSGELQCANTAQFLCGIDIAESQTASSSSALSSMGNIESICVLKRISSRVISPNLSSIRILTTAICFPQEDKDEPCEHASYLLRSLRNKNDALLLEVTFTQDSTDGDHEPVDGHGSDRQGETNGASKIRPYTRQALLHSTVHGSGIIQILEDGSDLRSNLSSNFARTCKAQPFSMAMMETSWSKLGAFIEQEDRKPAGRTNYRLEVMPTCMLDLFKPTRAQSDSIADSKNAVATKPLPGDSVAEVEGPPEEITSVADIDSLCLGIRKAYLEHLYQDECTVISYVKRLNAATKEITALAAIQSVPLKEAQQKLVAFIIEFIRIWPSRMTAKYKQIGKELNIGKTTDSKSQDHYVILQDERPELDDWKARVMKSVKDSEVRMLLRKLKAKDTQIQIVQNLHILLLLDKYGLEENKPFKKDPGALKTVNLFMDELCIAASLEDRPAPGLMSPQTPRSKDMDPAKKFFTRVVARYYGPSLPKAVEKLSIKCGVEKSLLMSPRPSRGSKRAGIKRSISMGVLQKPSPLDFTGAMEKGISGSTSTIKDSMIPKHGFPMSRQTISDNPSKNVLNSSIFRNRQVVMTRGTVKGLDAVVVSNSAGGASSSSRPSLTQNQSQASLLRSKSMNVLLDEVEEEDDVPKLAKLKLKKFYHDKESEEVLKMFRRKGPLSKADAAASSFSVPSAGITNDGGEDDDDDDDLGELGKYLSRNGTTSWGVIKSMNVPSLGRENPGLKSPSSSAAMRRSPKTRRGSVSSKQFVSPLGPTGSFVPSTPTEKQGYGVYHEEDDLQTTPLTPSGRAQLRRYRSQQMFSSLEQRSNDTVEDYVPTTPTRKGHTHHGQTISSHIRGSGYSLSNETLSSPSTRLRQGAESAEDLISTPTGGQGYCVFLEEDDDDDLQKMPSTPSRRAQFRRYHSQQMFSSLEQRSISAAAEAVAGDYVPTTPTKTKREQVHHERILTSHIRGSGYLLDEVLGTPCKRQRQGDEDSSHSEIFSPFYEK